MDDSVQFSKSGLPILTQFSEEGFVDCIDLPNELVSWNEKDPDYRAPLIKGLSWPAA